MPTPVVFLLLSLSPLPTVVASGPVPELDARFQRTEGWIGGDGVFSVPTPGKKTLWLFSDTWVGSVRAGKRVDTSMVNNSIGVLEGAGRDARMTYTIARGDRDKTKALFIPPDGRGWFWLYAGIHDAEKLHVFLPRLEKTKEPGAFGFRAIDLFLGTINNPADDPATWKTQYSQVPFAEFAREKRSFGSALLRVEDHIFIYGYLEKPGKPFPRRSLLIARVPAGKLADFASWRFFAAGEWKSDVALAAEQADGLATEFSVSYLPGLKLYALVYTPNGLSEKIVGRFSTRPEGPWSEPVLLHTCPEMKKDKKVFTYAAKAHPHLASGNELIVSYCVNAFELSPVLDNTELYWPRFVRVELK